jgi:hypothetical protein
MTTFTNSLRGRISLLAANTSARTGLQTTCGWTPSATDPLVVIQLDTRTEWLFDGTNWLNIHTSPRGGVFGPAAQVSLSAGVTSTLTLTRQSGDTDMISSGNILIPTGWTGTWAMTLNWLNTVAAPGTRTFVDLLALTSGQRWRMPIISTENTCAMGVIANLNAGEQIQCQMYCAGALTNNTVTVEMRQLA